MSAILEWMKKDKIPKERIVKRSLSDKRVSSSSWTHKFLAENKCFCQIDKSFLRDSFSHYGLSKKIKNYKLLIKIILDEFDASMLDDVDNNFTKIRHLRRQAGLLYGLLHARYILTRSGLSRMRELFEVMFWGVCPRVGCNNLPLLPIGMHDEPGYSAVKFYCGCCGLIYYPSTVHTTIDGAYFGSTFPHLFFLQYPNLLPTTLKPEELTPAVYGFKLHPSWQKECRNRKKID